LKERKKERIFISQPQHDRYYMIYSKHSKHLLASERKKYIIVLFTDWVERDGTPLAEEDTGSKRPDIIGPGQGCQVAVANVD
jgi:hypothetical protein